ncbi:MAG: hypothetical protein K0Q73_8929 [Paenibacillus sp.]|jgi:hypothetical protein|nr:hypothetical protein [Paenibacillus sp.]
MGKELSPEARKKLAAFMAKKIPIYEAQMNKEKKQGA